MLAKVLARLRRKKAVPPTRVVLLPYAQHAKVLSPEQRAEIRRWYDSPTTQLVFSLMESQHPGTQLSRHAAPCRSEWDEKAAVNLLHRIRGWETYRDTLLNLLESPATQSLNEEDYPS